MRDVLDNLGVREELLTPAQLADLDTLGYCRYDDFLDGATVSSVLAEIERLLATSGRQGGTLHLGQLLEQGPAFDPLWLRPELLAGVAHLLGDDFRLGEMHYRAGLPGHGSQALHLDTTDRGAPGAWQVCTCVVALTEFTDHNGATRVVPGSHLDPGLRAPTSHDDHPAQVLLNGPAGTAWLFNSHLWHSGTRNRSSGVRHAVLTGFHRRGAQFTDTLPSTATIDRLGEAAYLLM